MITKDDFEQWRDNPVTQAVLSVVEKAGEGAKIEFQEAAWDGKLEPDFLAACRATYETAMMMQEWTFENFSMVSDDFEDVKEEDYGEH